MSQEKYYSLSPQTYDDQFWWKKDDIEFWKFILNKKQSKTLELAAGTGRLALPLIRENINYTGLEISKEYCDYANNQISTICKKNKIIHGDMRSFNLNQTFDNIFIGFNSLLHLLKEKDLQETLGCIKKHMNKRTNLFIDVFVPHALFLSRNSEQEFKICEFFDSTCNSESTIYEVLNYDYKKEIMHVKWRYKNKKKLYNQFMFKMKMYYPDTMNRILTDEGFKIKDLWGDYNKSKFNSESPLQIYRCVLDDKQC